MEKRIIKQVGAGVTGQVYFEAIADQNETVDISLIQSELGYVPAGYGGPCNVKETIKDGKTVYTWYCYASCD